MDPLTIGLALGFAGSLFSANAQNQQGKYNQYVANFNARQLQNDAVRTRIAGNQRENDLRRAGAELASSQKASFAANGVDVSSGSAAQVQNDTKVLTNIDALRIRNTVDQKVTRLNQEAAFRRIEGVNARQAGRNNAIGTLLSGGSQFAMGLA